MRIYWNLFLIKIAKLKIATATSSYFDLDSNDENKKRKTALKKELFIWKNVLSISGIIRKSIIWYVLLEKRLFSPCDMILVLLEFLRTVQTTAKNVVIVHFIEKVPSSTKYWQNICTKRMIMFVFFSNIYILFASNCSLNCSLHVFIYLF